MVSMLFGQEFIRVVDRDIVESVDQIAEGSALVWMHTAQQFGWQPLGQRRFTVDEASRDQEGLDPSVSLVASVGKS
jgi:hypothetical protein